MESLENPEPSLPHIDGLIGGCRAKLAEKRRASS
jgi:hypothetical protein